MSNYNRKDSFYKQAKDSGYRSRAYFKLKEIQQKHTVIARGDSVLDMGAWPGGWMQYARSCVGSSGLVTGIDLVAIDPFEEENVHCITGDLRDEEPVTEALTLAGDRYDVLVSDMSPKLSGIKVADRLAAVGLLELALFLADKTLKPGGNFVAKAFKCNESEEFIRSARPLFSKLIRMELKSTRKTSTEFYIIGFAYKGVA